MLHKRGSAFPADPLSILDGACPRALRRCASAPSRPRSLLYSRPCGAQAAFRLCRHQPLLSLPPTSLSLPPTSFVQITLCHRKVPRPPAGPLMRTSAHPASTIDPVSARKKLPTIQNITPPHQAVGSIRFPRRISRPEDFRQGRFGFRAASAGLKCFRLGRS